MAPTLISAPTSLADQQWFFSPSALARPPSVRAQESPITLERERYVRRKVVKKLWELQNGIDAPTLVVATASIFMHRFYMRETVQAFDPVVVTAASFFLASKVEERPRSLRSILGATLEAERRNGAIKVNRSTGKPGPYQENDPAFVNFRRKVLHCEETMLRALCFDLTIRLPYPAVIKAVERLWKTNREAGDRVKGAAWAFVNDSLSSVLPLIHRPNVIAAAAIVCACQQVEVPLPAPPLPPASELTASERTAVELLKREQDLEDGEEPEEEPYWLELLDVKVEEVQDAATRMMETYTIARDEFVTQEAFRLKPKVQEAASHILPSPSRVPPQPLSTAADLTTEPDRAASITPASVLDGEAPLIISQATPKAEPAHLPELRATTTEEDFNALYTPQASNHSSPAPQVRQLVEDVPMPPPPPPPPAPAPLEVEKVHQTELPPAAERNAPSLSTLASLSFKRSAPVGEPSEGGAEPDGKKAKLDVMEQ